MKRVCFDSLPPSICAYAKNVTAVARQRAVRRALWTYVIYVATVSGENERSVKHALSTKDASVVRRLSRRYRTGSLPVP